MFRCLLVVLQVFLALFHNHCYSLRLMKQRPGGTRKWPITLHSFLVTWVWATCAHSRRRTVRSIASCLIMFFFLCCFPWVLLPTLYSSRGFCDNVFLVIFLKQNIVLLRRLFPIYKDCLRHFTSSPNSPSVESNLVTDPCSCPFGHVTGRWKWIWGRDSSLLRLA